MTTFNANESGSSVRTKINAAITTVDALRTGDNLLLTAAERSKLSGVEANAKDDQTGAEMVTAISGESDANLLTDAQVANIRTLEQFQDNVAAMLQAGTHTNITVNYNDATGAIDLTGSAGGGGGGEGLTQEEVEDFVGGLVTQGTGINVTYDDANNVLSIALTGETFTTAEKNKLSSIGSGDNLLMTAAERSAIATNSAKTSNATHTGDVTGSTELTIESRAVTYDKMQAIDNDRFLGRVSSGSGSVEALTVAQLLTALGLEKTTDPVVDSIGFFDVSQGQMVYFTAMPGLSISGTTLTAAVQSVAGETGAITAGSLRTALNVASGATANTGVLADLDEVGISEIDATGTASATTYLRGDGAWATPAGGGVTAAEAREVDLEAQTATSYSLVAADNGKTKQCNNASAITVTIPANATTSIDVGTTINFIQYGAGAVTITAAAGVTLNGVVGGSGDIATRYRDVVTLTKIATDEWIAIGGIGEVA